MHISKFLKIVLVALVICIVASVAFFYLTVAHSKPTSVQVEAPPTQGELKVK
jgi:hypothetical protein